MIVFVVMDEEGIGCDWCLKVWVEKDMYCCVVCSFFIKELVDELVGRFEEVRCFYEDFDL